MSLKNLFTPSFVWVRLTMIVVFLLLSACSNEDLQTPTPTYTPLPSDTPEPTNTPAPTNTLTPTHTLEPPKVSLVLQPPITDLNVGDKLAILLSLDPPAEIAEANWSIITGNGDLEPETGKAVSFTATQPDVVIIQVSGTTITGVPFEDIIPLNVVPPTPTPSPTPRPPCTEFTAKANNRTSLPPSLLIGEITEPHHCDLELPTNPNNISVGGTAVNVPDVSFLWLFVYAPDGKYYPQCDDALEGRCGANYSQDKWGVNVFLGRTNCKEHFHLVLVETDSNTNLFLIETMKSWADSGSYDGFTIGEILEMGILELDGIEVETAGRSCP